MTARGAVRGPVGAGRPGGGYERGERRIDVRITDAPIDGAELLRAVGSRKDGAALVFEGRVRELNEGREVSALEYDAYREMAERVLREIAEEVAERFRVGDVAAVHRVGVLEPGTVSVAIAVAAPHREACYAASRHAIEEIKRRLPVWKRERYAGGEAAWLGGEPVRSDGSEQG